MIEADEVREILKKRKSSLVGLWADIDELVKTLIENKLQRFKRFLPLGELFVDRWEKARRLGFGEGTSVYDSALIFGDVSIGENTWVGPHTVLDGSGGKLEIGSYCSISAGVQIYTHDTVQWSVSGGKDAKSAGPTKIGARCYLGPGTIVAKGVTIGDGTVIGANSLVLHDLPAGVRAWGTPARVVT